MFSLQKLAVFALVVAGLWLAFRFVSHLERRRHMQERLAPGGARRRRFRLWRTARADDDLEMDACSRCGAFVAPDARPCRRRGCPLTPAA